MVACKYGRWHDAIIVRAKLRTLNEYKERHHIQPRSLGGSEHASNLVDLTYREHFLVHWLLVKIVDRSHLGKMAFALHMMAARNGDGRPISSWRYDVAKRAITLDVIRRQEQEQSRKDAKAAAVWGRALKRSEGKLRIARKEDRAFLQGAASDWIATKYPMTKSWPDQVRERQRKARHPSYA